MSEVVFTPIGIVHSPHKQLVGTPIQPAAAQGILGIVEIKEEFVEGLKDLAGFSHITLVYHFHLSKEYSLLVKPFMGNVQRGVFATRAPRRPNPIGISIVRVVKLEKNKIYIENVDLIDGTPLLDIKPYVPAFDQWVVQKNGWLEEKKGKLPAAKDDGRCD